MILRIRLWILSRLIKKVEQYADVMKPGEKNFIESAKRFVEKNKKDD